MLTRGEPLVALLLLAGAAGAGELERLRDLVRPGPGEERWAQIPWATDLMEARERGGARPILLWEMDGHPLGCT